MPGSIAIATANVHIQAKLNDSPTAKAIIDALPIKAKAQRWGGEIYFTIPVQAQLEVDALDVLQAGELGYWPPGKAFCIFFGPTPASHGDEIRAASPVNVIGNVEGNLAQLRDIPDGADIFIEAQ